MGTKTKANILHHTHWDNEWYFTEEDSLIQLNYHFSELLSSFEKGEINNFYFDGQTAIIEDYLLLHPEKREEISKLVKENKLVVGPFLAQLDCFISSGEAVINNLKQGIALSKELGHVSNVAYLPDSFGQTQDFPKIFNHFDIHDFVFRRGMGDEHNLALDFIWKSNDGSKVFVNTLNSGYGFATDPFVNKTLLSNAGVDYDGKDVYAQIKKLETESALEREFLLPIGNDQTPVIRDFNELLKFYNENSEEFEFVETTLVEYMQKLHAIKEDLKVYEGEFLNPQYHRVHKSIYSARADIKELQDKLERLMALEVQPIMSIMSIHGLEYDKKIVDRIWNLLIRSQTHSSATNTDKTNELIYQRTQKAYNLADSLKIYLMRKAAISYKDKKTIVVFNTLPYTYDRVLELDVYTSEKGFQLLVDGENLSYDVTNVEKIEGGTLKRVGDQYLGDYAFYKTTLTTKIDNFEALSFINITVKDTKIENALSELSDHKSIENDQFIVELVDSELVLTNKVTSEKYTDFIHFENSGDEGDNYDYSNPTDDLYIQVKFDHVTEMYTQSHTYGSKLVIKGKYNLPFDLADRANANLNAENEYELTVALNNELNSIDVSGYILNTAENHRMRLLIDSKIQADFSYAGTQFGVVKRHAVSPLLAIWKEEGWLEEPTSIEPLLNHVSVKNDANAMTIFTRGIKEYQICGSKMALTIFRSAGHLGLPDLNRRPGRASGLAEKIVSSPLSQMKKKNTFDISIKFYDQLDESIIFEDYNKLALTNTYYQDQSIERVAYPIGYFHTNTLVDQIDENNSILELIDSKLTFSTIETVGNDIAIRLFNSSSEKIEGGKIKVNCDYNKVYKVNLLNEIISEITCEIGEVNSGEIINILIKTEE